MPLKTATIIGATGLIGGQLVNQLQQDEQFGTIRVLVRRPTTFSQSKVEEKLVNFRDPESFKLALEGSDVVFCAVGTTQKKVQGDKDAYRKVDYDIPVHAARFCAETGCQKFLLVSAVGANRKSGNFYLRLKGEVEDAVQQFDIKSVSIFRPSILLGKRTEKRTGEKIGQVVMKLFSFLLLGSLKKYKPVKANAIAAAMIRESKKEGKGRFVYEFPF
ncbi:NAD(P)H-binding protein [Flavisolibacter nicotianae]|uniref:NAD(P)H-binding protein n=1 Tax=Flavisolibacter nicotianae TaxID=2364882 RepID=UPI000EB59673|nr:NAD(P)H-binding protein [Flavisolibacter nicotianae]